MKLKSALVILSLGFGLVTEGMSLNLKEVQKTTWYRTLELSAAGGPNWLNTSSRDPVISSSETDHMVKTGVNNRGTWKVGIGYYFLQEQRARENYLNELLIELNAYQISGSITGDIWQYGLPQFDNYRYQAPFTSTRFMLDFKPQLMTFYEKLSPYLILGVGVAWNQLSYRESIIGADTPANSNLILSNDTSPQVAGDLGVGLHFNLTEQIQLSAEYIYGFMGTARPEKQSLNGALLANEPRFSMQTQTLLIGLNLKLNDDGHLFRKIGV